MLRINSTHITDAFNEIKFELSNTGKSLLPVVDLIESNSFIEGNKVAITQIIHFSQQKAWKDLNTGEKFKSLGGRAVNFVSDRFDYLKAVGLAAWDFIATMIRAIASTILRIATNSATPVKHWRQTGVALFAIANSAIGVLIPLLANGSQLLFSALVIRPHVEHIRDSGSRIIEIVRQHASRALPAQQP